MWDILAGQAWKNAESKGLLRGKTLSDHVDGIISEIDEALEAYEAGRFAKEQTFHCKFEESYKDTFEDELADIVLRTLTMCKEYGYIIREEVYYEFYMNYSVTGFINILKSYCNAANFGLNASYINFTVVYFCNRYGIPLAWHIQEKMKYNKSRPFLHGKVDIS